MDPSIRLLHLEDDARDAELIRLRLQADQLSCAIVCVKGKEDFESALQRQAFDLVLSDYKVPGYDGLAALRHVRKTHPELPVIMISGGLSEEEAVDCLKAGATDYVLKQRPQRLETAVRRALVEKEERAALRRAQEEISRQNLFLRQVIDLNPNFIFAKDREGRFVLVNHAMAQAYGTTVEEMTGKTESEVTSDAQEVARFLKADLDAMDTLREVFIAEEKLIDAAGKERWLQTVKRPIQADNGIADRVLGVSVDITERKRADEDIRALNASLELRVRTRTAALEAANRSVIEANRFLDSVIDNIPHMIFVKNADDLRVVRVNRAVEQTLGYSKEDLLGKPVHELFPEAEADFFVAKDREVLARGEESDFDESIHTCDKGVRILHTKKLPILDEFNRPRYLLGISEDVTEAKKTQSKILTLNAALERRTAEADAANRAKSSFLATMSHEIRTPMNGMLGMLELLSLSELDGEQRATLELVRESSQSLLRIIDDILDFSRIEAGKLEVRPEAASLAAVIEHVHNIYAGSASGKGLLVRRSVDPRISQALMVDPLRLRQILTNFMSNALKFTTEGAIEIRAEMIARTHAQEQVRLSVQDTGIGISRQDQQRLFQPFSQVEGEGSRQAGGTGLGLAICRRLAELMGGRVEMASEPGKGTTMTLTLTLPIANPGSLPDSGRESTPAALRIPTTGMGRTAPSVEQAQAEGTLVLLADDHPINRMLLARQVQTLGYAAESAEDGVQALEMWKTGRFAIVVTDCNMPRMDGYELARSIRRIEEAEGRPRVPIVACTANALRGEAAKCIEAGMDDCLVKPVQLSQLLKKLGQWLPVPAERRPGAGPAAIPVDLALIARNWGGGATVVRDILAAFRAGNDEDAAKLRQAIVTRDMSQVTHCAHRMLGASRMVGALEFALVCEQIDHASCVNDWTKVLARMQAFEREWKGLNAYFESLRRG